MSKKMQVSKKFKGEMTLPFIGNQTMGAGAVFYATDDQFNSTEVKMALKRGILVDLSEKVEVKKEVAIEKVDEKESIKSVDVGDLTEEQNKKFNTLSIDDIVGINPEKEPTSTNSAAWDMEKEELLGKDDSSKKVMEQMNSTQETIVKTTKEEKDIDLDTKVDNAMKEITDKIKVGVLKNNKKSKTLKPVGVKKELAGLDSALPNEGEIAFVDQEQEIQSILDHPVLKEKFGK